VPQLLKRWTWKLLVLRIKLAWTGSEGLGAMKPVSAANVASGLLPTWQKMANFFPVLSYTREFIAKGPAAESNFGRKKQSCKEQFHLA
jgi:hypothetical protein